MRIKSIFGLDIGSYSIKATQIKYRGEQAELVAASIVDLATSSKKLIIKDKKILADSVKKAVSSSRPRPIDTKLVVSALPESKVYSEVIVMPAMEEEELKTAVPLEAGKHMPMAIEDSYIDYHVMENISKEKLKIFIVAAPKDSVDLINDVVSSVGFELVALETKPLAAIRALISPEFKDKCVLILDIGAENSSVTVTNKGEVAFAVTNSFGGETFVKAVEKKLSIKREEALKMSDLAREDENLKEKILKTLYPLFDNAIQGVEKAIDYYQSKNADKPNVSKILLAGGGSITPGIQEYVSDSIKIETEIANPFINLRENDLIKKIPKEEAVTLTTSIGLALRKINQ